MIRSRRSLLLVVAMASVPLLPLAAALQPAAGDGHGGGDGADSAAAVGTRAFYTLFAPMLDSPDWPVPPFSRPVRRALLF